MTDFLRFIGGSVLIISSLLYMLAIIFSPIGVLWLVLNH